MVVRAASFQIQCSKEGLACWLKYKTCLLTKTSLKEHYWPIHYPWWFCDNETSGFNSWPRNLTVDLYTFQKKALGQELYERVFYSMDIIEKDYFGLQYTDANHVPVSLAMYRRCQLYAQFLVGVDVPMSPRLVWEDVVTKTAFSFLNPNS